MALAKGKMAASSPRSPAFERWRESCDAIWEGRSTYSQKVGISRQGDTRHVRHPRVKAYSMMDGWFAKSPGKDEQSTTAHVLSSNSDNASNQAPQPTEFEKLIAQEAKQDPEFAHQRDRIERWKDQLLRTSPMVRFMAKHLMFAGCSPFEDRRGPNGEPARYPPFLIAKCEAMSLGGFAPPLPGELPHDSGIVLCANRIRTYKELEHVLSHEMIHWWDSCRFNVDFDNKRHHACTEIRAAMLSGECSFSHEKNRLGPFLGPGHFKDCVRRRASASLAGAAFAGVESETEEQGQQREALAARQVDEVFDSCFNDTRPFDEVY